MAAERAMRSTLSTCLITEEQNLVLDQPIPDPTRRDGIERCERSMP
jgi:hypothetical protein